MTRGWREPFDQCYAICSTTGCWLWQRALKGCGYGHKYYDGKYQSAHRIAWQLHKGPIPEGMSVLHRCDVMRCVNPEHLFLGTHDDNMADQKQKLRRFKAHCSSGHLYTDKIMTCRACRQRWRRYPELMEAV